LTHTDDSIEVVEVRNFLASNDSTA
jgi:hypothetical protein